MRLRRSATMGSGIAVPTRMQLGKRRLLVLVLGASSLHVVSTGVSSVFGSQTRPNELATIEGTAFDALYWYLKKPDAVIPEGGPVVLEALHGRGSERVLLDETGGYRLKISSGIYELGFANPRHFLPYRRARILISPGTRNIVNLYPIQHAGVALTVQGDVALADPKLLYETYYPDKDEPDLDMLIQYEHRTATPAAVKYEGGFLTLTFDKLTLRASVLILNRTTLTVEVPQKTFVDLGSFRLEADKVSLNSRKRVITVFIGDSAEERHF